MPYRPIPASEMSIFVENAIDLKHEILVVLVPGAVVSIRIQNERCVRHVLDGSIRLNCDRLAAGFFDVLDNRGSRVRAFGVCDS